MKIFHELSFFWALQVLILKFLQYFIISVIGLIAFAVLKVEMENWKELQLKWNGFFNFHLFVISLNSKTVFQQLIHFKQFKAV